VIDKRLSVGFSFAEMNRDGFTVNSVTGNDIDTRSAFSGKAQDIRRHAEDCLDSARALSAAPGFAAARRAFGVWRLPVGADFEGRA
jgi:hypothetical protein